MSFSSSDRAVFEASFRRAFSGMQVLNLDLAVDSPADNVFDDDFHRTLRDSEHLSSCGSSHTKATA